MTSLRRPAFSSAFMLALNIGIVVVRNAEAPLATESEAPVESTWLMS